VYVGGVIVTGKGSKRVFSRILVKVITESETMRQACKLMYQHNIGSIIIVKNEDRK